MPKTVLITGANRGVGLELLKQIHKAGFCCIGGYRDADRAEELLQMQADDPERVIALPCEVTSEQSLQAMAAALEPRVHAIDILINNAGVLNNDEPSGEKIARSVLQHTLDVNLIGPILTTQTFLPFLRRGTLKKLVFISSIMGSINLNKSGSLPSYRISKAALNQFCRSMALELAPEGVVTLAVHPGWAQTDMGGPQANLPVTESAAGIVELLRQAAPATHNGRFFDYTGRELAW